MKKWRILSAAITLAMFFGCCIARAQSTPSNITCGTPVASPSYVYNGAFYICVDGSPVKVGASASTATSLAGGAKGSIPYQTAVDTTAFVAANTANNDAVLTSTGNGTTNTGTALKNAPALSAANMTNFPTLNQSTTGNAATATNPSLNTPPAASLWTTPVNQQGTFSLTNIPQGVLFADSNTATFNQMQGALIAYPSTPFTLTVLVGLQYNVSSVAGRTFGILTASSATGNMEVFGPRAPGSSVPGAVSYQPYVLDFSVPATFSATASGSVSTTGIGTTYIWLQYKDDGTTVTDSLSGDGYSWGYTYQVAKSSGYLHTNGYNYIGIGMYDSTGSTVTGTAYTVLSWNITTP